MNNIYWFHKIWSSISLNLLEMRLPLPVKWEVEKFPFSPHVPLFVPSEFCVRWVYCPFEVKWDKIPYLLKIRWLIRAVLALLDFIYSECFKADFFKNCFSGKKLYSGLWFTDHNSPVKILVHFGFSSNLMYLQTSFACFKRDNQWSFSTLGQFLYYPRI